VSIHAALTPETRGMVGATEFALMKRGTILVNCARGEIVQEAALADALRSERLAGAAVDVFATEPPAGRPLLCAPNAAIAPLARSRLCPNGSWGRARSAASRTYGRQLRHVTRSLRTLAQPQEVSEDVGSELGVLDLRMELEAKQGPIAVPHRLDVAVLGAREAHEVTRELCHLVVVGLPHLEAIRESFEKDVGLVDVDDRLAELGHLGGCRVAARGFRHELVSRADSEDGGLERIQVLPVPAHLSGVHPDPGGSTG